MASLVTYLCTSIFGHRRQVHLHVKILPVVQNGIGDLVRIPSVVEKTAPLVWTICKEQVVFVMIRGGRRGMNLQIKATKIITMAAHSWKSGRRILRINLAF
jgi:hypothetical protein